MPERCELLIRAKAMAARRGLESSKINCPIMPYCSGEKCEIIDPTPLPASTGERQVERFYGKLEKHAEIRGGNGHQIGSGELPIEDAAVTRHFKELGC